MIDGTSIAPALRGEPQPGLAERPLYWEFHERGFQQAARIGRWKGIRKAQGRPIELYDLSRDIGETADLAAREPEVARRLEAFLDAARTDSPDWPVKAPGRARPTDGRRAEGPPPEEKPGR